MLTPPSDLWNATDLVNELPLQVYLNTESTDQDDPRAVSRIWEHQERRELAEYCSTFFQRIDVDALGTSIAGLVSTIGWGTNPTEVGRSASSTAEAVRSVLSSRHHFFRFQLAVVAVATPICGMALLDFLFSLFKGVSFFHPFVDLVAVLSTGGLVASVLLAAKEVQKQDERDV